MVGGKVIETLEYERNGERRVWINVRGIGSEKNNTSAISVEDSPAARCVEIGDSLWWQGQHAFWTPRGRYFSDYKLRRMGCSGQDRPVPDELLHAFTA